MLIRTGIIFGAYEDHKGSYAGGPRGRLQPERPTGDRWDRPRDGGRERKGLRDERPQTRAAHFRRPPQGQRASDLETVGSCVGICRQDQRRCPGCSTGEADLWQQGRAQSGVGCAWSSACLCVSCMSMCTCWSVVLVGSPTGLSQGFGDGLACLSPLCSLSVSVLSSDFVPPLPRPLHIPL